LEEQLGLLHHPLICDTPRPYRAVTVKEFKTQVPEDFGLELAGIGIGA
jgi:hypothetical protein